MAPSFRFLRSIFLKVVKPKWVTMSFTTVTGLGSAERPLVFAAGSPFANQTAYRFVAVSSTSTCTKPRVFPLPLPPEKDAQVVSPTARRERPPNLIWAETP